MILVIAAGLCSCGNSSLQPYQTVLLNCFSTEIELTVFSKSETTASEFMTEARTLFENYSKLFDIYYDYEGINNLKTVNDNAGITPVKVDEEIIELLKFSKEMYQLTDGNVNVAFGAVLELWHEARTYAKNLPEGEEYKAYLPDMDALNEASKHCNIDDIIIDEENSTVFLKDSEMSIDVGAVAKGFATERVTDTLIADGYKSFRIISGSSSIKAIGTRPGETKVWTAIVEGDINFIRLNISDKSISTSGVSQNYYTYQDENYHHIINKDTLMPNTGIFSLTIITDDAGKGDALSTGIFNMGIEDGIKWANEHDDVEVMFLDIDKNAYYSNGFKDYIID